MDQTVRLCDFDTVERKIFTSCQVNCFTGKGHNLYGIDIPFQFDERDDTMTATYGDATSDCCLHCTCDFFIHRFVNTIVG